MVKERIKKFICTNFLYSKREIEDKEPLIETGIIDSMGLIKLLAFIQETFNVPMEMSEISNDNFDTLEKIVEMVKIKGGK